MKKILNNENIIVRELNKQQDKQTISTTILNALPDWFGIPESTQEYIDQSRQMPFFVAFDHNKPVGFIAMKETSDYTAEIYVMGVHSEHHNQGIGKALFSEVLRWAKDNRFEFLQVKTLAESHPDQYYARTRKFYQAIGFKPLETLSELWGKDNPCLIMIQHIG